MSQYDEAVEALCGGVDLDPDDPRPLTFLGLMHDVSPALSDKVTQRLAHFVEIYPRNAAANYYYAISLWKRTSGEDAAGRLPKVEALLKEAVRLDPRLAEAHFQLGLLHQEQSNLPSAIREFASSPSSFDRIRIRSTIGSGKSIRPPGRARRRNRTSSVTGSCTIARWPCRTLSGLDRRQRYFGSAGASRASSGAPSSSIVGANRGLLDVLKQAPA